MKTTDLSTSTAQEVFDFVVRSVIQQGRPSISITGFATNDTLSISCLYRTTAEDGTVLKCAAGHLLHDNDPVIDHGGSWSSVVTAGLVPEYHWRLVNSLQLAHDAAGRKAAYRGADFLEEFTTRVEGVARDHSLLMPA